VSEILSIISIIVIVICTVYYSIELIKKNQNLLHKYPMNGSSLFHFINLSSESNSFKSNGIDFLELLDLKFILNFI